MTDCFRRPFGMVRGASGGWKSAQPSGPTPWRDGGADAHSSVDGTRPSRDPSARSCGGRNVVRIWRPRAARRAATYKIPPTANEIVKDEHADLRLRNDATSVPMTHAT